MSMQDDTHCLPVVKYMLMFSAAAAVRALRAQ